MQRTTLMLLPALLLAPAVALAHPGHDEPEALLALLAHRWLELHHLAPVLALGLAASIGLSTLLRWRGAGWPRAVGVGLGLMGAVLAAGLAA